MFPFADYLINKDELSTSCKENENPDENLVTAPENIPAPQPKLSENNKSAKIAKPQDDVFEDDDDVFQQYLPGNFDNASSSAKNTPQTNLNEQITGTCNSITNLSLSTSFLPSIVRQTCTV